MTQCQQLTRADWKEMVGQSYVDLLRALSQRPLFHRTMLASWIFIAAPGVVGVAVGEEERMNKFNYL